MLFTNPMTNYHRVILLLGECYEDYKPAIKKNYQRRIKQDS